MSMEDILKALVVSRQQGSSTQGTDSMTNLIGGLLGGDQPQSGGSQQTGEDLVGGIASLLGSAMGGGQSQPPSHNTGNQQSGGDLVGGIASLLGSAMGGGQSQSQARNEGNQQSGGLGNMMGLLETVMGGGQNSSAANDPIMVLLKPFVAPLAKKAKIPPEIAMIIVSFAAHKLLAHHPTSERDSNSFDLEHMLQQINSGKIDPKLLHNSGMVKEISTKTGLDDAAAEKSLNIAFSMVGKSAAGLMKKD